QRASVALGEMGSTIWRHVAVALGIDPELSPIEALRQGIDALWKGISDAVRPLVEGLRDAWRWLRDESPLGPLLRAIEKLTELWAALKDLWNRVSQGAADWFASALDVLSRTVLPIVDGVLWAVSAVAVLAVDAVD